MLNTLTYLWKQRTNIKTLVLGDFVQNYLSSYLGFIWAFLGPMITLTILAVVFEVGFRVPAVNSSGTAFIVWLACGMIPWLYIADGLSVAATSILSYSFLVSKVGKFRIMLLPLIRIAAAGIIHCVLLIFLCILLFYFDIGPSWYWLQLPMYLVCIYSFLVSIGLWTSSLSIFVPDIPNLLNIIINLGFWTTPILWNVSMLPKQWNWVLTINPAYYLVQGYRDTFIEHRWIWERPIMEHVSFFIWVVVIGWLGSCVFKKLRPYFADVL